MTTEFRIVVEYDSCPDFSYLTRTAEEYYGAHPECPKCGYSMAYGEGHTWYCDCTAPGYTLDDGSPEETGLTVKVWGDTYDQLKELNNMAVTPDENDRNKVLPFDEYRDSYGNPNNYVCLVARIETACECCGSWGTVDSLGGLDIYEYSSEHWETGTFSPEDLQDMPEGFLRSTLEEMLEGAKEADKH